MTDSGERVRRFAYGIASAGLVSFWVNHATATELCNGRVCPEKFECRAEVSSCPPGEPDCEPLEDIWCASPECTADTECPSGMRCVTADKTCRPKHELPCNTNTDCGAGFTCEAVEGVSERYCAFSVTACTLQTANRDCASGWTCVENVHGLCANPGDPHTGCNPGDPEFVCLPPYLEGITTALDGDSDPGFDSEESSGDESNQGCSFVTRSAASSPASWLLAGAFGVLLFARRRSQCRPDTPPSRRSRAT